MRVNTITIKTSPFFSRVFAVSDLENKIIPNINKTKTDLNHFLNDNIISLDTNHTKKHFNIKFFDLGLLHNLKYHYYLRKKFSERRNFLETNYVVMFLQVQPEQTTLPDGDIFVSQLEAVKISASLCKQLDLKLVIREHPSTGKYFDKNWRNKSFIDKILSFEGDIFFDDYRLSNKEIIKNSKAVVSTTGTVLVEALINQIPVIAFGKSPLLGFNGHSLIQARSSEKKLLELFKFALKMDKEDIYREIVNYLQYAHEISFGINKSYSILKEMPVEELWELIRTSRNEIIMDLLKIVNEEN